MSRFSLLPLHTWLALLCVGLLTLLVGPAAAQTPAATIEDDGGTVVLESYADGALVAPGTFNTGTIPATGAGTRLMWYPAKAAFRAGRVGKSKDGTQWDSSKVGSYSVAFGVDTKASGSGGVAMGNESVASNDWAVALGFQTTAGGAYAMATGEGTVASGIASVAMGDGTTASKFAATAIGGGTTADEGESLVTGECNATTTGHLLVVGNGSYDFASNSCDSTSDALLLDRNGNLTVSSQNTFSDRRLKTDIEPLGAGILQRLAEVRPVRYEFKNQETHPAGDQIGLIAQDVRKEFPELVSGEDDKHLSLSYSKFTAVLLKGLQEQQTQIDQQNDQIDRQRATIDSLKTRVQKVEDVQARLAELEAEVQDRSVWAGVPGSGFGLGLLLGGLLAAGLLWRSRS